METELRSNLTACASAYAAERGISLTTLGRLAAGDWRFFDRVTEGTTTFTARKYDEVMLWFSERWPAGCDWPGDVPRPVVPEWASEVVRA
jgi:hypothetical protein